MTRHDPVEEPRPRTARRAGATARRLSTVVAAISVAVAACAEGEPTLAPTTEAGPDGVEEADGRSAVPLGPRGEDLYQPPDPLPPGAPGDLVWARPVEAAEAHSAWVVLYRSETVTGDPVAVSGVLVVPTGVEDLDAPPILAWAHGTTGLADHCAPSRRFVGGDRSLGQLDVVVDAARRLGAIVVATDYQGLGTPGEHPYAVNVAAARDLLDSIRLAQRFPGGPASDRSPAVLWGHSQGGGAAAVAAELAPHHAPELDLRAAVVGAPAAELASLASELRDGPYFGYVVMAASGFAAAYPELDLAEALTEDGLEAVATARQQCLEPLEWLRDHDPDDYLRIDPGRTEPFASRLEENAPGLRPVESPVLLYHGEADDRIPTVISHRVFERYCRSGSPVVRRTYPDAGHLDVNTVASDDIVDFLRTQLRGGRAPEPDC